MDGSSRGDLENGSAAATANELWQRLQAAVVRIKIAKSSVCAESMIEALIGGGAIRKELIVVRGGVVVIMIVMDTISINVVIMNLRVIEAVLAEFLVEVLVGGGGGTQLLAVGLSLARRRHRAA